MTHGTWIPKGILERDDLPLSAKLLYGLVDALSQEEGCFASNDYVGKHLGLSKRQVQNLLNTLLKAGLIVRQVDETTGKRHLWTVEKYALKQVAGGATDFTPPVQSISPPPCNSLHPYNKEDKKDYKSPLTPLPHGQRFKDAWHEWLEYRVKTKKRLSRFAADKQLKMLEGMTEDEAVACINRSITNDWQGLFPEKKACGNSKSFSKILTRDDHNNGF